MTRAVVMRTSGGLVQHDPTDNNRIRAVLGALSRDQHVILERFGSSDSYYIQVWLRSDGLFQLEYRAGQPSEHYQTRTDSRDKVVKALSGWVTGKRAWRVHGVMILNGFRLEIGSIKDSGRGMAAVGMFPPIGTHHA